MSEQRKGYPTIREMQDTFPDYPCGRKDCRYFGDDSKIEKCTNIGCTWFDVWFSEHWQKIRKIQGIPKEKEGK